MLFRKEVLESKSKKLEGDVVIIKHGFSSYWMYLLFLVIALAIFLICTKKYAKKQVVVGQLVPKSGVVKVYGNDAGIIVNSHARKGYKVNKGDKLFSIDTSKKLDESSANMLLILNVKDQLMKKQEELLIEKKQYEEKLRNLKAQEVGLLEQKRLMEKRLFSLTDAKKLRKETLKEYELFRKRELITETELTRAKEAYLSARSALENYQASFLAHDLKLSEARSKLKSLPLENEINTNTIKSSINKLDERLIELKRGSQYLIKAPISGSLTTINSEVGHNVSPNKLLATIIPVDMQLVAEIYLPSRAVGFVKPGLSVKVRYDSFPYEHFGVYEGTVISVSDTPLAPADIDAPVNLKSPMYIVKVKLNKQSVETLGKTYQLRAGMSLSATVVLEERLLIDWILKPLYQLRESL